MERVDTAEGTIGFDPEQEETGGTAGKEVAIGGQFPDERVFDAMKEARERLDGVNLAEIEES